MDGYQFTAAIFESFFKFVGALAWPAAIVISVWLFREKLVELLPRFTLKHKEWEASFRLDQAEKEVASLPPPSAPPTQPTPEESTRFDQLSRLSPRGAIMEARTQMEEVLRKFAELKQVPVGRTLGLLGIIRLLRNKQLIDEHTSGLLDDLRAIGNAAAHDLETHFTPEDAIRFRKLANDISARLTSSLVDDEARKGYIGG